MTDSNHSLIERGLLSVSDLEWERARLSMEVISPLAKLTVITSELVDNAAKKLGVSRRQIYLLIERYRQGNGLITDMLTKKSFGGKGKSRLSEKVDNIIREVLQTYYLNKQKYSKTVVWQEVALRCRQLNLSIPSKNTVGLRIQWLDPYITKRKREGTDAARALQSAGGVPPEITTPLEQVQMDHTIVDVIIVDDLYRQPIGRPYITVAIDVFSRCIVGVLVTLEAPSAVSVGLCLSHVVTDKRSWLERLGVTVDWPMAGKPLSLYLDNATEFKSEALRRGCEQHGIALHYRPPGKTHYGGIVERIIGTLMERVHALPGTTFSNVEQKGAYDSDAKAALTLEELEKWLVLTIAHYHGSLHHGIHQTPQVLWQEGIARTPVHIVSNARAFLVDFLPVIRRKISRTGFLIDHIYYYADVLKPWIARRRQLDRFIIRRNPLDLSRIWILTPEDNQYLEIPYRTLSRPTITLWEHRHAIEQLHAKGRSQVNENRLFAMVEEMRDIAKGAQSSTRKARRNVQRLNQVFKQPPSEAKTSLEPPKETDETPARPFDQIEEWS